MNGILLPFMPWCVQLNSKSWLMILFSFVKDTCRCSHLKDTTCIVGYLCFSASFSYVLTASPIACKLLCMKNSQSRDLCWELGQKEECKQCNAYNKHVLFKCKHKLKCTYLYLFHTIVHVPKKLNKINCYCISIKSNVYN